MFDIGFFELVLIGIIALLVLGPERLPHAVRMTGAWIGNIRRATQAVRDELEREVNAQELQKRLREEMDRTGLNEAKASLDNLQAAMKKNLLEQEGLNPAVSDTGTAVTAPTTPDHPATTTTLAQPSPPAAASEPSPKPATTADAPHEARQP